MSVFMRLASWIRHEDFSTLINSKISEIMCQKIGLSSKQKDADKLLKKLLKIMKNNHSDFTLTFRNLSDVLINGREEPVSDD